MTTSERLRRLLDEGHRLTYAEMREHVGAGERQIRRYFREWEAEGVYVKSTYEPGVGKRFYLPDDAQRLTLPGIAFDTDELRALTVAASASQAALGATPLGPPLARAFGKLLQEAAPVAILFDVDATQHVWYFDEAPAAGVAAEAFRTLQQACEQSRAVEMVYYTASRQAESTRTLRPYGLVRVGRTWMVVGHDSLRNEVRSFALDCVRSVRDAGTFFDVPDDFDLHLFFRDTLGAVTAGSVEEVVLLVEPDCAPYWERKLYAPTQQIDERRADGRLVVSFEAQSLLTDVLTFVRGWGPGVTVLRPAALRDRVQEEARALARRYG
jgi:predicted DNA-binding transcriptional regulator YafY